MGAVRRPSDELDRKIEEVLRDLSPDVREAARRIIENYRGKDLEKRLEDLIGIKRTRDLIYRTR
jgi:hypothetical protein